ncbi:hypothetical protein [Streptomyces sp. NPDC057280]|uniref:hypothetical protein n=1 Tax=Streptomyces sp. NPDC057280 TaxID=3346081 RepID=UPI003642B6F6
MARRPQPRHITLGGHEAVALTVEEYEQLIASRRQIGGQSARVRVLASQAKRTEQLLRDLETLVGIPEDDCGASAGASPSERPAPCRATAPDTDAACLRCAIAALLRRHRDPAA